MSMFGRVVSAIFAGTVVFASGAALAADLEGRPSYKDTYAPPPAMTAWTGLYAGLQLGYGWGESNDVPWGFTPGPLVNNDGPIDLEGWVGGIHLGYNVQTGYWVLGVEGDLELSNIDGNDGGVGGDVNALEADWMASLRLRAGYLVTPASLFYVTGGVAWLEAEGKVLDENDNSSPSYTFTGWTIGTGLEHAITRSSTIRLEYRYTDFGNDVRRYANPTPGTPYRLGFEPTVHAVRVGVSIKLQ